jgi:hypothetical protein
MAEQLSWVQRMNLRWILPILVLLWIVVAAVGGSC